VTLMLCFLSSWSFLPLMMPMSKTLHISFFRGSILESTSVCFLRRNFVTFLTDFLTKNFFNSSLMKKFFFCLSLSLSLVKRFLSLSLSLSRRTHSLSRSSSSSV
jgi:hypothetical protein